MNFRALFFRFFASNSAAAANSERRFQALIENSSDAIALFSAEGHILYGSPATTRLLGYSLEEFIGLNAFALVHPDDHVFIHERLSQSLHSPGTPVPVHARVRHKNGSWRLLEGLLTNHLDEPTVGAIVNNYRDITETKYAEEALRDSEARSRAILETTVDAIITIDDQGAINLFNPAAERLFGYRADEVAGRNVSLLMPSPYQEEHDQYLHRYLTTGERRIIGIGREVVGKRKDGTTFPMELAVSELRLGERRMFTGIVRDITERTEAEAALRDSEERFRATFEQAAVGIAHIAPDGRWLRVNQRLCDILGYSLEELLRRTFQELTYPDDLEADQKYTHQILAAEIPSYTTEKRYFRRDGSLVWINLTVSIVREPSGEPKYFIAVIQDIGDRKRAEEQLGHAQKLDSIGRLAGGIAHDFNNLLTAIFGFTELAVERAANDEEVCGYLKNTLHAAERARDLTRQLLAFARRQMIEPQIVDLNVLTLQLDRMLRRIIGEDLELVILPQVPLWQVRVDPSQVEQVIVNLIINARDAMPDGGKVTIETYNAYLDEEYAREYAEVVPGEYVMMAVSDTGQGMTEEVKRHIFEPFFTTKGPGKGTGLGLATCYGIVKQSGGHMWFYSEPGKGSTFKVYLPRAQGEASVAHDELKSLAGGLETVLVVEDEPLVRAFATQSLRERGYTVLEASNGVDALRVAEEYSGNIHLLLTDVVMPQMGGKALAERLSQMRPALKVLYTSGYTDNAIVHHGTLDAGVSFLQKPYTSSSLARRVREVLDLPASTRISPM